MPSTELTREQIQEALDRLSRRLFEQGYERTARSIRFNHNHYPYAQEAPLPITTNTVDTASPNFEPISDRELLELVGLEHHVPRGRTADEPPEVAYEEVERLLQEEEAIEANIEGFAVSATPAAQAESGPVRYVRSDVCTYFPATWNMPEYPAKLRQAADFLRLNSSGRYSDRTHGRFTRMADAADRTVASSAAGFEPELRLPTVFIIEEPFSYDEETEVKSGGIIAVGLVRPSGDEGKQVIYQATRRSARRRGAGLAVTERAAREWGTLNTFINAGSAEAMLCALKVGFTLCGYNPNNGVAELMRF